MCCASISMIERLRALGVRDDRVLDAMARISRAAFVPQERREEVYDNRPLRSISGDVTASPEVTARMIEALQIDEADRALVVAGSGYEAALVALLAKRVTWVSEKPVLRTTVERVLAPPARAVRVVVRDASLGVPSEAPFDGILVAAACPYVPHPLVEQLTATGRLVLPVGDEMDQWVCVLANQPRAQTLRPVCPGRFLPLVGRSAWRRPQDDLRA